MAELSNPVVVQAQRIDASLLPAGFSVPYQLYVIQQSVDINNAAEKANEAASGAYDAQQKNAEQDESILSLENRVGDIEQSLENQDARVSELETDYVSKKATETQVLHSSLDVSESYSVDGKKVIGPQQTGWTAATGNANRGEFDSDLTFSVGATYSQSEIQSLATALIAERQRTKALEDALRAHGLID